MKYQDRYEKVLDSLAGRIHKARQDMRMPVFGFTSNLDLILEWDPETYSGILDRYLKEEPSAKEGDLIRNMEDFARISAWHVERGLGGDYDIVQADVCSELRHCFPAQTGLGGTCAQGAAALGQIGMPVCAHISDKSADVCEQMDHPGTVSVLDGELVPIGKLCSGEAPVSHIILQFRKGSVIRVRGEEKVVPDSNRLILFYDTMQKTVPVDEGFLTWWEDPERKETASSCLISGFDAIIDENIMEAHCLRLQEYLKRLKEKDPRTVRYFEGAFYMNPAVKTLAFRMLAPYSDIIGMNEEELTVQVKRLGKSCSLSSVSGIREALDIVLEKFPAGGIVLHTKDYSMYYGKKLDGIDIGSGLTMGNLMSGTRARIGRYGTCEDLRESLCLPLSETGLRLAGQAECENTGDRELVLVPSRYLEHPKYTIGLGDTFVAGVHTCFI